MSKEDKRIEEAIKELNELRDKLAKHTKKDKSNKKKSSLKIHEEEYIHIPKINLLPIIGSLLSGLLVYLWGIVVIKSYYALEINKMLKSIEPIKVDIISITFIPTLLVEYILISLVIISIAAIFKGGYKKLNSIEEKGVIDESLWGLSLSLFMCLVLGLPIGILFGDIINAMIQGLFLGFFLSLSIGLTIGLSEEFNSRGDEE